MDVLIYFSFMTAVVDIDASRNGSTGTITSPGYPGNYPNNVTYTWTLKTGNLNATVSFNFQDFDIIKYRYTPHCQDYLQINETEPCCFKAMHRCGNFKPVRLTVHGSVITITFESDNLHNSKGFHLTWTVYIPRTPAVGTISLWTSKIQTKSSAKIPDTTGPKILGTTDPEIPTSKTENIIGTSYAGELAEQNDTKQRTKNVYSAMIKDYRKTCWILLIAFFIQQTLRQMSCSTQMIRNSDVISSKISHGTSKTAEWIVTQSENCNPTSTKVAIGRLWSEYEKLRKNKTKTDGSRKFTEFLETEFAPPTLSTTVKSNLPEATCLINSSGDATSTAISI
uniref:CUB domain-containing protein n=1 Tax=Magallana gigas TaxID=29159 RepID=A0A8W8JUQ4_MAGGI